ncbi:class I SAM-dependent methyltransferase [Methylovirgula sp. 4M-Z18]|uniref:class I SAM-dependent methyltransferase n=1 Tax=Methylovirgula sp. 4M-Z18 TaxID=2293567 RepID=UPI000E2FD3D3|nr:class I SAM-dependent methyltransferase [Methylovirgula sp. 4M-Z18]RFB79433.1 class I SAM-dependent methyltransferase [Methylovirgula sp. 4M-Z18]
MRQALLDGQSLITPALFTESLYQTKTAFDGDQLESAVFSMSKTLDQANLEFSRGGNPSAIIDTTARELHLLRNRVDTSVWQALLPIAQEHPVAEYFLQDPFTRWSFTKPRGYSGDAGLLDFIYGHSDVANEINNASPIGRALYDYTKDASSSVAVRERRDLLTKHVDAVAAARGKETEILTIAAGHLREANRSQALQEDGISRWVALDQDPDSVESIRRDFAGTRIQAVEGSVRGLLTKANTLGTFDFIYAAGLYDYLSRKVAIKLTQCCLNMLKPNGVFLFANFAQEIGVDGYMETFMNWPLLLRSEEDMSDIVSASIGSNTMNSTIFFGENRNVVYATIQKIG